MVIARAEDAPHGFSVEIASDLFGVDPQGLTLISDAGDPPAVEVRKAGQLIGYLASTWQVARTVGYSGKPIDITVAVRVDGSLAGARLIRQSEPVLTIGISPSDIAEFVNGFADMNVVSKQSDADEMKTIAGATVSSGVIADGIMRAARSIILSRRLLAGDQGATIDRVQFEPMAWSELVETGAIQSLSVTIGEARAAIGADDFLVTAEDPDGPFIELSVALLTPPKIGENILGSTEFSALAADMAADDNAILVAGNGLYSFKGTNWRKSGTFDRIQIIQGNRTLQIMSDAYKRLDSLALDDAPEFRDMAVFVLPAESGLEPAKPWRLSVLATHELASGAALNASFALPYALPDLFFSGGGRAAPAIPEFTPLWELNWRNRIPEITVIAAALLTLYGLLIFQDQLARNYQVYRAVRLSFLVFTFLVIGLWFGAQLSIVQLLAYFQSLRTGFQWETFLLDPLIFILWSWVAVALLFWGRGVYCGWLCPFGALQELVNQLARTIGIRQLTIPFALHERLWPMKYIIFLGLAALSLKSMPAAFFAAEVEPFKTVFTLKLDRAWPFVAFAVGLLVAGLFVERFYCRYLCPLGAALAIPARLRMFEWLKRRHQCGRECRICAVSCTVQAIHPDGHINPNECIYCLKCQTNYYDPTTCPPLKDRLRRREARRKIAAEADLKNSGSAQ